MNKTDRKHFQTERQRRGLEQLAQANGLDISDRTESVMRALRRLETRSNRAATDYCNGDIDIEGFERYSDKAEANIARIFGGPIHGFFVNGDCRGYALKIRDEDMRGKYDDIDLHRDWGGYGILAPEITGD